MAAGAGTVCLRWAVSLRQADALPHFELLFRRALQCLPPDDVAAQSRFRYRDDALACVLGRLLIRRAFGEIGVPWEAASRRIMRSPRGKPEDCTGEIVFNVSHQGDLVVLAASSEVEDSAIGVDVMRVDEGGEGSKARIERLRKAFTPRERESMLRWRTERERWISFYRHWCLKEAVLKATGAGISEDLGKLEFRLREEEEHVPGCLLTTTEYFHDGARQGQFVFEESFVGDEHVVAVGRIRRGTRQIRPVTFSMVEMEWLLEAATVVEVDEERAAEAFTAYDDKKWKTF